MNIYLKYPCANCLSVRKVYLLVITDKSIQASPVVNIFTGFQQMMKKEENIKQLENNLQEYTKELTVMRGILPKVSEERDLMWDEVRQYSEKNMLLNSEVNILKKKIESLDEDILLKEGQITILKDTLGNIKPFDLLSDSDSTREFLLE